MSDGSTEEIPTAHHTIPAPAELADWRRRIGEIYAAVRQTPDPSGAWLAWRAERDRLFASHPQSPLPEDERRRFDGLSYFEYDPAFRFAVVLRPIDGKSESWEIGQDGTLHLRPFAKTEGLAGHLGRELLVYWLGGYGGGIFLPFADASSGSETYGGGRYVLDGIKGADLGLDDKRRTIVDFNFAYCPSCAYNPAWTCPLPPAENRLSEAVRAGERL